MNQTTKHIAIQEYSDFQQQYFINNVNTYLGYELVNELRNDHEIAKNPHKIFGSLKDNGIG